MLGARRAVLCASRLNARFFVAPATPEPHSSCQMQTSWKASRVRQTRAIFEFDKLVRSSYSSQNRIESYHQLRSTIAQVGGKKELSGRTDTDIEMEISNQCARLIANAIIYYNSAILSYLLTKWQASCSADHQNVASSLALTECPAATLPKRLWPYLLTFDADGKPTPASRSLRVLAIPADQEAIRVG